jgi:hypothetical protein
MQNCSRPKDSIRSQGVFIWPGCQAVGDDVATLRRCSEGSHEPGTQHHVLQARVADLRRAADVLGQALGKPVKAAVALAEVERR